MSEIFLLGGDLGKESVMESYQAIKMLGVSEHPALNRLHYLDGSEGLDRRDIVVGANLPSLVILNSVLENKGYTLATLPDLLRVGDLGMSATEYTYAGVAVKSDGLPNKQVAQRLISQARELKNPMWTPFIAYANQLKLGISNNPHGLEFCLRDGEAKLESPAILNSDDKRVKYNHIGDEGYPVESGDGKKRWLNPTGGVFSLGICSEGVGALCGIFQDESPGYNPKIAGGNYYGLIFVKKK